MTESEYPSWKKALFGQDTIANIRCAVKYAVWHVGYALLTIIGITLVGIVALIRGISDRLARISVESRYATAAADAIGGVLIRVIGALTDPRMKKVFEVVATILMVLLTVVVVVIGLYAVYLNPWLAAQVIALFGGAFLFAVVGTAVIDYIRNETRVTQSVGAGISRAKETAAETPGVRRVYGNCPVHFNIEPKWFQKIDAKMENVVDESE